jgi:RES domain-containing protein
VISVYRLSSALFPANNGMGAALFGGRWNRVGTPVIYAAQSASLAALEVLVHYSILPKDHELTEIQIPDTLTILRLEENRLPDGWDAEAPIPATQNIGEIWVSESRSAILSVPSSIVPSDRNFILNPTHPDFADIAFQPSLRFHFDPRLKKQQ